MVLFFFFNQKTAYEMRISDWSSDVCSSDLTRPCTKHNYLVKNVDDLARIVHEAFYVATNGRPGPVVIDLPKDIQVAQGAYTGPANVRHKTYRPRVDGDEAKIKEAIALMAAAERPVFYTGGGKIGRAS